MKNAENSDSKTENVSAPDKRAETIFKSKANPPAGKSQISVDSDEISKLKEEISLLKKENFNIKTLAALEKSGCLKPELAAKTIPENCENIQEWVEQFKAENDILFRKPLQDHGNTFKPTQCTNLSPVEIMNNYIRGI